MSKQLPNIDPELAEWISRQRIFFIATAPLSAAAHLNISPKGADAFRVLSPMEVAYQDFTGSGAETAGHLRENGRIIVMFCAFDGAPKIVRLHGRGELVIPGHARFQELVALFPPHAGTRAIVHITLDRVSSSCGFSVPFFDFRANRDALDRWTEKQSAEDLIAYRAKKNRLTIDGLPAFPCSDV
jgi:hypothetical protein